MISLALGQGPVCMVAIVFFTCVWIPLRQLRIAIGNIIDILSGRTHQPLTMEASPGEVKLPVCRFEELHGGGETEEEVCSICLVEFAGEDLVSQLHRCRHVFHLQCIESWLQRNHFTCPLCRSFLFTTL